MRLQCPITHNSYNSGIIIGFRGTFQVLAYDCCPKNRFYSISHCPGHDISDHSKKKKRKEKLDLIFPYSITNGWSHLICGCMIQLCMTEFFKKCRQFHYTLYHTTLIIMNFFSLQIICIKKSNHRTRPTLETEQQLTLKMTTAYFFFILCF